MTRVDALVIGAGFAGATVARLLADAGHRVVVAERRAHIGGNAFDEVDAHGVRVHRYGPHIFHSNASRIVDYLSRFTAWRPYEHRVLAEVDGQLLPIPINRTTINSLYGLALDEAGDPRAPRERSQAYVDRNGARSSEDIVLASVGRDLYERFYRGYTRKQWGIELADLAAVGRRARGRALQRRRPLFRRPLPVHARRRLRADVRAHARPPGHRRRTRRRLRDVRATLDPRHVVYTGPIDACYDHRFGALPYRSIRFEHEHLAGVERASRWHRQPPERHAYTRITEFKHLTGQMHGGTSHGARIPLRRRRPVLSGATA